MSFHLYFFAIFISLWGSTHDSADCWSDHSAPRPKLPATASNVCTTDARLGAVGRVAPKQKSWLRKRVCYSRERMNEDKPGHTASVQMHMTTTFDQSANRQTSEYVSFAIVKNLAPLTFHRIDCWISSYTNDVNDVAPCRNVCYTFHGREIHFFRTVLPLTST